MEPPTVATGTLASFPPLRESVAQSRGELRKFLNGHVEDTVCDIALLLESELATNAVLHAATDFVLSATFTAKGLHVAVEDRRPGQPPVVPLAAPDVVGGRGVLILNALAEQWGVEPTATGKRVWFELSRD